MADRESPGGQSQRHSLHDAEHLAVASDPAGLENYENFLEFIQEGLEELGELVDPGLTPTENHMFALDVSSLLSDLQHAIEPNDASGNQARVHESLGVATPFAPAGASLKRRHDQIETPTVTWKDAQPADTVTSRLTTGFRQVLTEYAAGSSTNQTTPQQLCIPSIHGLHDQQQSSLSAHGFHDAPFGYPTPTSISLTDQNLLQVPNLPTANDTLDIANTLNAGHGWQMEEVQKWTASDAPFDGIDVTSISLPQAHKSMPRKRCATSVGSSYACTSCLKDYHRRSDLDHHSRYHGPKKHPCPQCDMAFHFPKDLRRHEVTHGEARDHMCEECDCRFKRPDHLRRHVKRKHPAAPAMSRSVTT